MSAFGISSRPPRTVAGPERPPNVNKVRPVLRAPKMATNTAAPGARAYGKTPQSGAPVDVSGVGFGPTNPMAGG